MSNQAEITGYKELMRYLRGLDPNAKAKVKTMNADLANTLADDARSLVRVKSGALAGSVRGSGTLKSGVIRMGRGAIKYAKVQEFGWPRRNIEPMHAFFTTLDRKHDYVINEYVKGLDEIVGNI